MAYLTEAQKTGIANLLQDWPIQPLIDYDRLRPMRIYEPQGGEELSAYRDNPEVGGMVVNPFGGKYNQPKGPPLGLAKTYGADPFAYIRDLEKFQPDWTPGATEEGELNKILAERIGHETRHHEFIENPELLSDFNIPTINVNYLYGDEEGRSGLHEAHETYNYYLDAMARDEDEIKFPIDKGFLALLERENLKEGVFGVKKFANLMHNMRDKYLKHVAPKGGPQAGIRQSPVTGGGGGGWSPSGADLSPGGGYGQSPTGADIEGTPFARGGILGAF